MKNYHSLLPNGKKAKNELKTTIFKVFHLGTMFKIDLYLFQAYTTSILSPNRPNTRC